MEIPTNPLLQLKLNKMNAKQLYDKHLKLVTPDHWIGEKQLINLKYEASLNAINEALTINQIK